MARVAKKAEAECEQSAVNSLVSLRDKLAKAAKGVHVSILSESDLADRNDWVETPGYDLNRIISGDMRKGLPWKTFWALVAPEASGKSSLMALIAAKARESRNSIVVIIDSEGAWSKEFVSRWGLDPSQIIYIYTPWIDEIKTVLANIIDGTDKNLIICLDSVGGIEKKKIQEDALKGDPKADQGTLQKELKPMYKMLANIVKTKDSIAIMSAHFYGNPGGYGTGEEVGGGKYLKLAVDGIISFKKAKLYNSAKEVIGNSLKVMCMKNRFYPPFNEATMEINFESGVNKYAGILQLAEECGLVDHTGNTFTYIANDGTEMKRVGENNAKKILEVYGEEIVDKLNEYIQKTGFSTINTEMQALLGDDIEEGVEEEISVVSEELTN